MGKEDKMQQEDFFELFYSNLRRELGDYEFVNSIEKLISKNKFNKNNYLNVLIGDLDE